MRYFYEYPNFKGIMEVNIMINNNYYKISLVLIFLFSFFMVAHSSNSATADYQDFKLEDTNGNIVNISDYQDKIVVLEWINPDCPFVKRHGKEKTMKTLSEKYNKEVVWLGVNSTHYMTKEDNAKWIKNSNLSYAVLDDHKGKVGKLYDAKTTPHMFILDVDKKNVLYEGAIDDDPRGTSEVSQRINYVDTALSELASGKDVSTEETKPYGCSVKYK